MAFLMLYGNGWTQRWRIPAGTEERVANAITRVGSDSTARLSVVDPGSDVEVILVVAWHLVAAAVVVPGPEGAVADDSSGLYA